ncbi:helix-turn-helix domain-containing protein [Nocardia sp. NPDC058705]|uniref:helix-turn-helix domain-containing protein n=1 Tax=Nocardia sp. NPDC058705 TaxID=3346609 RepID=UPI00368A542C
MSINLHSEIRGPVRMPTAWTRPGHIGYVGPDLRPDTHAPPVAMLTVGLDGPLIVHTSRGLIRTGSSFAPARTAHRVVATEGWILVLFIDPSSAPATMIADEMTDAAGTFGLRHRRERELVELCGEPVVDPERIYQRAIAGPPLPTDPRIARLTATIRDQPSDALRADQIAANLGLSTGHFLHLFTQHCGTTFRGYQRWNRMVSAITNAVNGHDLTRSAIDAGFATPSHFSESFRAMIGLPATKMLGAGIHFDLGPRIIAPS